MKEETARLSASLEDYLKEIYLLNLEGQEVRITDIARSLGALRQDYPDGRRP